jgi:hypothetical protein
MGQLFGGLDGMRPSSSTSDGMGEYSEDRFSKPWVFLTLGWGPHGKIPPQICTSWSWEYSYRQGLRVKKKPWATVKKYSYGQRFWEYSS